MAQDVKVKVDMSEWEAYYKKLEQLERGRAKFFDTACRNLAARLLALVIPRTPVGEYLATDPFAWANYGKKGGTLRRGWTVDTHEQAATDAIRGTINGDPVQRSQELPVELDGMENYYIEVLNPVYYAPYVESGHRTPWGTWVEGQYFLSTSEEQLMALEPRILMKLLERYIAKNMK